MWNNELPRNKELKFKGSSNMWNNAETIEVPAYFHNMDLDSLSKLQIMELKKYLNKKGETNEKDNKISK